MEGEKNVNNVKQDYKEGLNTEGDFHNPLRPRHLKLPAQIRATLRCGDSNVQGRQWQASEHPAWICEPDFTNAA